jgi:hypothetical protein
LLILWYGNILLFMMEYYATIFWILNFPQNPSPPFANLTLTLTLHSNSLYLPYFHISLFSDSLCYSSFSNASSALSSRNVLTCFSMPSLFHDFISYSDFLLECYCLFRFTNPVTTKIDKAEHMTAAKVSTSDPFSFLGSKFIFHLVLYSRFILFLLHFPFIFH